MRPVAVLRGWRELELIPCVVFLLRVAIPSRMRHPLSCMQLLYHEYTCNQPDGFEYVLVYDDSVSIWSHATALCEFASLNATALSGVMPIEELLSNGRYHRVFPLLRCSNVKLAHEPTFQLLNAPHGATCAQLVDCVYRAMERTPRNHQGQATTSLQQARYPALHEVRHHPHIHFLTQKI